jgi:hypothetical protein
MESSALRAGEAIRQARREERCGYIGRAAQRSGRPPARNPKGRALLRRGFVEGLARSSCYATSPFSCPCRKIAPAQAFPYEKNGLCSGSQGAEHQRFESLFCGAGIGMRCDALIRPVGSQDLPEDLCRECARREKNGFPGSLCAEAGQSLVRPCAGSTPFTLFRGGKYRRQALARPDLFAPTCAVRAVGTPI